MRLNEFTSPAKPATPEQLRLAGLKAAKESAAQRLQAEKKRQQMAKAQTAMAAASNIKPVDSA